MSLSPPPTAEPPVQSGETLWQTFREMVGELIRSRDLLWQMTLRDLRIRYKQAALGVGWALLLPCLIVIAGFVVRTVIATLAGQPLEGQQIASVALKALPWGLFVGAVGTATVSLTGNLNLVTKIYFPREVFPLASLLTQVLDSSVGCVAVGVILIALQAVCWSLNLFWVPLLALLMVLLTAGACLFLSCANLFFRDVRYLVQVGLMFGMFFTPVFFDAENLGPVGCQILMLNPLTPVLEGLRLAVIEGHNLTQPWVTTTPSGTMMFVAWHPLWLLYSLAWAVPGTLLAWLMFHKLEFVYAEYV
jgi:ABC-type polysaccharide/polyol phosphate export permease